jgi:hypothetical protein
MESTSYTIGAAISWSNEGQGSFRPFLLALFTNVPEDAFYERHGLRSTTSGLLIRAYRAGAPTLHLPRSGSTP